MERLEIDDYGLLLAALTTAKLPIPILPAPVRQEMAARMFEMLKS